MKTYVVEAKGWGHVSRRVVEAVNATQAVEKIKTELGIAITAKEVRP